VAIELRITSDDAGELTDLQEWLGDINGVSAVPVERRAESNSQGEGWDFLRVLCETGGPVVAALGALRMWLEARITTIELTVADKTFKLRSSDPASLLPQIEQAARALGEAGSGDESPR
jgi:hypothetical protein